MSTPSSPSTQSGLYRQAAIEAAFVQPHGKALLLPSINHVYLSIAILCICVLLIVFMTTQSFQQKAAVTGYLQSIGSNISITSKESTGVVKALHVTNGDMVLEGSPLLTIERGSLSLQGENGIQDRIARLQSEQVIQTQLYNQSIAAQMLRLQQLSSKLVTTQDNIELIKNQLNVSKQQQDIANEAWQNSQKLALQHLISISEKNQLHMQLLSLQKSHDALLFSYNQEQSSLEDIKQQISQQNIEVDKAEQKQALNKLELQSRMQNLRESASYVIYAPTQGEVNNFYVKPGDNLSFQQALMQLLPNNNEYEAILHVPNAHIGFVQKHQKVDIKIDAFSYQKYGSVLGEVSLVSKQTYIGEGLEASAQNTFYIVKVKLLNTHMQAKGQHWPIKSGMSLRANIVLSEPTLLEWLLAPLYDKLGRAA